MRFQYAREHYYDNSNRPAMINNLMVRMEEPWRAYHNISHIADLLDKLSLAVNEGVVIEDGLAALTFVLWHDAVYVPQAPKGLNEQLSAQLFETQCWIVPPKTRRITADAILRTIDHNTEGACEDIALLLDVDLSILGAESTLFSKYDSNIREEYEFVELDKYLSGRHAIFEKFMSRPRIFITEWAHSKWEDSARTNIQSWLDNPPIYEG